MATIKQLKTRVEVKQEFIKSKYMNVFSYANKLREVILGSSQVQDPTSVMFYNPRETTGYFNPHKISFTGGSFFLLNPSCFNFLFTGGNPKIHVDPKEYLDENVKEYGSTSLTHTNWSSLCARAASHSKLDQSPWKDDFEGQYDYHIYSQKIFKQGSTSPNNITWDKYQELKLELTLLVPNNRIPMKNKILKYYLKEIEALTGGKITVNKKSPEDSCLYWDPRAETEIYVKERTSVLNIKLKATDFATAGAFKAAVFMIRTLYEGNYAFVMALLYNWKEFYKETNTSAFMYLGAVGCTGINAFGTWSAHGLWGLNKVMTNDKFKELITSSSTYEKDTFQGANFGNLLTNRQIDGNLIAMNKQFCGYEGVPYNMRYPQNIAEQLDRVIRSYYKIHN